MLKRDIASTYFLISSLALGLFAPVAIHTISIAQANALTQTASVPVTNSSASQPTQGGAATAVPANHMPAAAPPVDLQAQINTMFSDIEKLVKKYYPKAKITISDTKMHFENKCSVQSGYYSNNNKKPTPEAGGVLGDISVESGDYAGKHKPREFAHGYYTTMVIAPYSKVHNKHLLVHLLFPPDIEEKFKDRFTAIVQNFSEKQAAKAAAVKAAAADAARKAAAEKEAQAEAAQKVAADQATAKVAAVEASNNRESTFGAATMSETKFPDGRFKVQFPDEYQTISTDEMGQRMTRYSAHTANGILNVSYMIMPNPPVGAAADALFAKLTANTIRAMNGVSTGESGAASMNGFPGSQISVNIKDQQDSGAILTLYFAGNYVYVLDAVGTKSWLKSDAVSQFMNSFVCWGQSIDPYSLQHWFGPGGYEYWCDAQGLQHWWDTRHFEHWRDVHGREHWYDAYHREHW